MVDNSSDDANPTEDNAQDDSAVPISRSVRFALLAALIGPSIITYVFMIIFIVSKRTLRSAPNNYVVLMILCFSLIIVCTDVLFTIDTYAPRPLLRLSHTFCLIWWLISLSLGYSCQILVVWASFERHLLIFHSYLLNTRRGRICWHYVPPLLCIAYMLGLYFYVVVVYPCEQLVDFDEHVCMFPCYSYDPLLSLWETICHGILLNASLLVLNGALLFRVYRSKARLKQSVDWRKYRQMIFQLISIATLYLFNGIPFSIVTIFLLAGCQGWPLSVISGLNYFYYFLPLLFPFLCLASLPEAVSTLKRILRVRVAL